MVTRGRTGFTLVEALIALVVASILVLLVGTTFMAQNEYYAHVLERVRTQDHARSVVDLVGDEVRATPTGGFVRADSTRLEVRRPLAFAVVCGFFGPRPVVYLPQGEDGLPTAEVTGVGVRTASGAWTFTGGAWGSLRHPGQGGAAGRCATASGSDTAGVADHYVRMTDLGVPAGAALDVGDLVMLYGDVELAFRPSSLEPGTSALFRGLPGGELVEYASGLDPAARFAYRTGDTAYAAHVAPGSLSEIDGVRVYARARSSERSEVDRPVTFELVSELRLRNRP